MKLHVFSSSSAFRAHLNRVVKTPFVFHEKLSHSNAELPTVNLLHITSPEIENLDKIKQWSKKTNRVIAICSDNPSIVEMLECVKSGAQAYCNSYMLGSNYDQMLRLVASGQSWFPPAMLDKTFELAQQAISGKDTEKLLKILTPREKELAVAVSEGLSNHQLSERFKITERTVKTHLSNVFMKLDIKDRVALVLYLK